MTKLIIIMLIALVLEALGVVYLSTGLKQIGEPRSVNLERRWDGWLGVALPTATSSWAC